MVAGASELSIIAKVSVQYTNADDAYHLIGVVCQLTTGYSTQIQFHLVYFSSSIDH
jgi:hypothetical protein